MVVTVSRAIIPTAEMTIIVTMTGIGSLVYGEKLLVISAADSVAKDRSAAETPLGIQSDSRTVISKTRERGNFKRFMFDTCSFLRNDFCCIY